MVTGSRSIANTQSRRVQRVAKMIGRDPSIATATVLLGTILLFAVVVPLAWPEDPIEIDVGATLAPPSMAHPMGTDSVGRDVLARFASGARISLAVGAIAVLAGATIGGGIGLLAGAFGKWVDGVLMRLMDAILAFPSLMLAMAVTVGLGAGLTTATIGIVLTIIPIYARVTRVEVVRVQNLKFVEAAISLGARRRRVIFRHVLPHVLVSTTILAAANFGYVILTLAALGFVGLGVQVPAPEWGAMITEGQDYVLTGSWWIALFPGLGVLSAVTAGNIFADRLRDMLDPSTVIVGHPEDSTGTNK